MKQTIRTKAVLVLQDGTTFEGLSVGAQGTTTGEMCFNTGMTGYQEIYTDPSYYGQIIINTTAHIGNYGVLLTEDESDRVQFSGLVCNHFSDVYSRRVTDGSLQQYFENNKIVGISGIDTRKLVRHIRHKGAMNGIISTEVTQTSDLLERLKLVPDMNGLELSSVVTTSKRYFFGSDLSSKKVAVLDLGIKRSILTNLSDRGIYCQVFPAKTSYREMKEWNPNGFFISNGPGDPAVMTYAVRAVSEMLDQNESVFGICLGHQILALANNIKTYKMHNGHRGLNHPVKNLLTGRSEITSQNHGFSVVKSDVENSQNVVATHINLNDNTIEGIKVKHKKAFSVQYHPEAGPGPHDSRYLFDQFFEIL